MPADDEDEIIEDVNNEKLEGEEADDADSPDDSEVELFQRMIEAVNPPEEIAFQLNDFENLRAYMTDCMFLNVFWNGEPIPAGTNGQELVVTNYVLRNQYAVQANLLATDPQANVQPKRKTGNTVEKGLEDFGETLEIVMNQTAEMGELGNTLRSGVQEALTTPLSWVKMRWYDDPGKTAVGAHIRDTEQVRANRYRRLRQEFDLDVFDEDDADYEAMLDLEESIREDIILKLTLEIQDAVDENNVDPDVDLDDVTKKQTRIEELQDDSDINLDEIPTESETIFQGFDYDMVQGEDIGWDWTILDSDKAHHGNWMWHRITIPARELGDRYRLTEEEIEAMGSNPEPEESEVGEDFNDDKHPHGDHTQGNRANTAGSRVQASDQDTEAEDGSFDSLIDVYEWWDKITGKVYVFTPRIKRFLEKYTPSVKTNRWYPFYPLAFNKVAGQFVGVSDVQLQRPLQDEINQVRSEARQARSAAQPRLLAPAGAISPEEKARFRNAQAFDVIEVDRFDELNKILVKIEGTQYNPGIYLTGDGRDELSQMSGVAGSSIGGQDRGVSATATANSAEQLGTQMDQRRFVLKKLITQIFGDMAQILIQTMDGKTVEAIAGENAVWPTEEEIEPAFLSLNLEINGGPNGVPDKDAELAKLTQVVGLLAQSGVPVDFKMLARDMLELLSLRKSVDRYIMPGEVPRGGPPSRPDAGNGGGAGAPPGPGPGTPGPGFSQTPSVAQLPGKAPG